jgi:hypothetical protein
VHSGQPCLFHPDPGADTRGLLGPNFDAIAGGKSRRTSLRRRNVKRVTNCPAREPCEIDRGNYEVDLGHAFNFQRGRPGVKNIHRRADLGAHGKIRCCLHLNSGILAWGPGSDRAIRQCRDRIQTSCEYGDNRSDWRRVGGRVDGAILVQCRRILAGRKKDFGCNRLDRYVKAISLRII